MLAGLERAEHVRARRLETSDRLDDQGHCGVGEDAIGIGGERPRQGLEALPRGGDVARHDGDDPEAAARPGLEVRPVLGVDLEHAPADDAGAQEPDADLAHARGS